MFNSLYKTFLYKAGQSISGSPVSDFVEAVQIHLNRYFQQYQHGGENDDPADLHSFNFIQFRHILQNMRSSNTCLCCLRRRPQYCLPCGHFICENCVIVFGDSTEEAYVFNVSRCFLCGQKPKEVVAVRVRPPTAGAGFLCLDGGGTRGIIQLTIMKLIQDRLGSIPLQRCIPLSFGVSVGEFPLRNVNWESRRRLLKGAVIAIDHFILGRPLDESAKMFSDMVKEIFKPRASSIPVVSHVFRAIVAYFTDGLYPASNIDTALRRWIKDRNLLDCSHATSTATKVALPVATVSKHPSFRFFTNYNGVGERKQLQGEY